MSKFVFAAKDGSGDIDGVSFSTVEQAVEWAGKNKVSPDLFQIEEIDGGQYEWALSNEPKLIEQGGTFVTDMSGVKTFNVNAATKEQAIEEAKKQGATGTLVAEKVLPTGRFLRMSSEERGSLLGQSDAYKGGGTVTNPPDVANTLPYSTSKYLAAKSVGEEPGYGSMFLSGLRDIFSLPGREIVANTPFIGNGDVGKVSEQYADQGFGLSTVPAIITDPSLIPMAAGGEVLGVGKLASMGKNLFKTPVAEALQEGTYLTGRMAPLSSTTSKLTNIARHTVPSAMEGGAYSAVGAGFNELTSEEQTIADDAVQVIGGAIASGAIGGVGSVLKDKVFNIIADKYPSLSESAVGYIMSKLGLTQRGTEKNISTEFGTAAMDITNLKLPYSKEAISSDFPKQTTLPIIKNAQDDFKGRLHELFMLGKLNKKEHAALLKEGEDAFSQMKTLAKDANYQLTYGPDSPYANMKGVTPEDNFRMNYGSNNTDASIQEALLNMMDRYQSTNPELYKAIADVIKSLYDESYVKANSQANIESLIRGGKKGRLLIPSGLEGSESAILASPYHDVVADKLKTMGIASEYLRKPLSVESVPFNAMSPGSWIPDATVERLNTGAELANFLSKLAPYGSGQTEQVYPYLPLSDMKSR